ncbi:hypothetical protein, partial [Geomonas sp.]|uniref:hypothetical protein n=1 Tax=Geomonas sp. TaxID=2651584 RepID=UPI002B48060A
CRDSKEGNVNLDGYKQLLAIALAAATCFFYILWFFLPPIRLVWRCLSEEENLPLLNTLKACCGSALPLKPAIFRKQMRLWLELRLLHPKPPKEPRWVLDTRTRRYQLEVDEASYRRELAEWKRSMRAKFGALKVKEKEPVIEVADVFRLNDEITKNGIKKYLLAVSQLKLSLDEEASFLCSVRINEGYLLPLNLLAGLMSRFQQDWGPIISSYDRMASRAFSHQQMTIFNLWLLWGPSVPVCSCEQWAGPVTLQYGFGDENNSVRIRVKDQAKVALLDELRNVAASRTSTAHPFLHVSITGKLWPPSSFFQGEICGAQQELLNPDREAFIIEYESHSTMGNPASAGLFYTAYVWALFVVGRENGPSPEEIRRAPSQHIIPFFEHGNIVDDSCYRLAKLQLAHKVLTYLKTQQELHGQPVKLWYVCALDDAGYGHSVQVPSKGRSIRATIEDVLAEDQFRSVRKRMILDERSFSELLSGCHFSNVISELFTQIEKGI